MPADTNLPTLTLSDAAVAGLFRLAEEIGAKSPVVDGRCFYCGLDNFLPNQVHDGGCLYILALNLTNLELLR